ncbi:MAG: hypothetical protein RJA61_443 [Candidatus Parcubacteria bacterium]|jgi:magnesium transporter
MIHVQNYKNITWLDLEKPTHEDVVKIMEQYNIDPLIARDLESPTPKPKIEGGDESVYLVLHVPVLKHSHTLSNNQEIDFLIGKNFFITTHYDSIDALHHFKKLIEKEAVVNKAHVEITGGVLFYKLVKGLYQALYDELAYINSWIEDIDNQVFRGNENKMVRSISEVSRALLRFKKTISIHKEMFLTLQTIASKTLGSELTYYAHILTQESSKALALIESYRDSIAELRETNNSLLSTKQNETTLAISAIALIALPISIIISLFQIDSLSRPIIGMQNDFWIISGGMVGVAILLYFIFKIRKLL